MGRPCGGRLHSGFDDVTSAPLGDAEEEKAEELEDFHQYVGKAPSSFGSLGDTLRKTIGAKAKE